MRTFILTLLLVASAAQAKPYFQKPAKPITLDPGGAAITENTGTLVVKGDAATTQDPAYTAFWCHDSGAGGCDRSTEGQLNVPAANLPTGKYWIKLGEAIVENRVEIQSKMATLLTLKSFTVKETGAGLRFQVFVDTNDEATRARILAFARDTADLEEIQSLCTREKNKTKEAATACSAWSKGSSALENTWIRFDDDAGVAWASLHVRGGFRGAPRILDVRWGTSARLWMAGAIAGESITLPSGVYGVRIENRAGLFQETYGVQVQ